MPAEAGRNQGALANLNFRRLWLGQAISQTGDAVASLTTLILINQLTGSTAALAGLTIAIALPTLLFGLAAGVFVDRWDRRKILIVSDLLRGLLVLGFIAVRRPDQIWVFYVLGFALAAVSTLFDPAKTALIPQLLPRESLLAANGLSQTTRVVAAVSGEALAGLLVGLAASGWLAFSLDSLSFFISAAFIFRIAVPRASAAPREATPGESAWQALAGGLRFTFSRSLLVGVIVTLGVTMLGIGALSVLFVPFLTQEIHVPTTLLGFVGIGQVIGMVLGSAVVSGFAGRLRAEHMIAVGVAGMGLFTVLLGLTRDAWSFTLCMFCVGLCMTPVQAASTTLVQQSVPDEKRGRVSSAMSTVMTLASVISMGLAGGLAGAVGLRTVFYMAGGTIAAAGLLGAVLIARPAPRFSQA